MINVLLIMSDHILILKRLRVQFDPPPPPPLCGFSKNVSCKERVKPRFFKILI